MINANSARPVFTTLKRFFVGTTPQAQKCRSRAGFLLAALLLPLLLGVLACLPVAVGDPEESRIDPALSGVWLKAPVAGARAGILVIDPYDKRTWLVASVAIDCEEDSAQVETGGSEGSATVREDRVVELIREGRAKVKEVSYWKAWLTEIEGQQFITWEPRPGVLSTESVWFVFRVRREGERFLSLDMVRSHFEGLEDVETREQAESVIRRNVDNPDLYDDDDFQGLMRVSEGDYKAISKLFDHLN